MGSNNIGYGVLTIGKSVRHYKIIIFTTGLVVKNYHLNLLSMHTYIVIIRFKL